MQMRSGGIDVFYIDESHDNQLYVVTALAIPLIRPNDRGIKITWGDYYDAAKNWRRSLTSKFRIPLKKELHGVNLASGRGNYIDGTRNFAKPRAAKVYREVLKTINFLPDSSILSASATRANHLYGNQRLTAALYALFQRMRKQCEARDVNAIVFFDQGHPEYRSLYRQAQIYLPTGSQLGQWGNGRSTKNLPLDMFFKDGNEKSSKDCFFTQLADLIAYAAFLKRKNENGRLTSWQSANGLGTLYDEIPVSKINKHATSSAPQDGIVRL